MFSDPNQKDGEIEKQEPEKSDNHTHFTQREEDQVIAIDDDLYWQYQWGSLMVPWCDFWEL